MVSSLVLHQHNASSFCQAAPDPSRCWRPASPVAFTALYAVLLQTYWVVTDHLLKRAFLVHLAVLPALGRTREAVIRCTPKGAGLGEVVNGAVFRGALVSLRGSQQTCKNHQYK